MRNCWSAVSVMRRSSGSRGRIEIRFSCSVSQFTALSSQVAVALDAERAVGGEVRVAEDRDARLGRTLVRLPRIALAVIRRRMPVLAGAGVGRLVRRRRAPAARSRPRPPRRRRSRSVRVRRPVSDLHRHLAAGQVEVALGPAPRRRLHERRRHPPAGAALRRPDRARQRKRRQQGEAVGDGMLRIRGGHRHGGVGAQELTDAADVDHDVAADLDAPLGDQADQVVAVSARRATSGGSSSTSSLPPPSR